MSEDLAYYTFISHCEMAESVQRAVENGWKFTWDYGERKFHNASITATKGEHKVQAFCGSGIEDIFRQINKIDYPEQW